MCLRPDIEKSQVKLCKPFTNNEMGDVQNLMFNYPVHDYDPPDSFVGP